MFNMNPINALKQYVGLSPPTQQQQASSSSALNPQTLQQLQQQGTPPPNVNVFDVNNIISKFDFDTLTKNQQETYIKQFFKTAVLDVSNTLQLIRLDKTTSSGIHRYLNIPLIENGISTIKVNVNKSGIFTLEINIQSNEAESITPTTKTNVKVNPKILLIDQFEELFQKISNEFTKVVNQKPEYAPVQNLFTLNNMNYARNNKAYNDPSKKKNPIVFRIEGTYTIVPPNPNINQANIQSGNVNIPNVNIPQSAVSIGQPFTPFIPPSGLPTGQQQQPQLNQPRQPLSIAPSVLSNFFATNPNILNKISTGINMDIPELKEFIRSDPKLYKLFVDAIKSSAGQAISPDMMNAIYNNISTLKELQDLQQSSLNSEMAVRFRKFVSVPKDKEFKTSKNLLNT